MFILNSDQELFRRRLWLFLFLFAKIVLVSTVQTEHFHMNTSWNSSSAWVHHQLLDGMLFSLTHSLISNINWMHFKTRCQEHLDPREIQCRARALQLSRYSDRLRTGRPGFDSRQCKIFLFSTASRPALGPTQPPVQWVPGAFSPGVQRQGREADHSPPSSDEVKNGGAISQLPHSLHGILLN
jgi:hypothetical protein